MEKNRIKLGLSSTKIVVVMTPMGALKLALPNATGPNGEDPVAVAMQAFQGAVDRGADDPLQETLVYLKDMADNGSKLPLVMGLSILKQMSERGMLPPMQTLIEGTGITEAYVSEALGHDASARTGILERLDTHSLN
jgi:hypothetical protein